MLDRFLFIGGYLVQVVASVTLVLKVLKKRSVYGLSSDTQICFLASTLSRVFWSKDTRLVETYLAHTELTLSTITAVMLCSAVWRYRHTTTKEAPWPLRAFTLTPVALLLGLLFHPGAATFSSQVLVAFSIYVEAMALLPQLYLMRKMIELPKENSTLWPSQVEPLTSNYVGMVVLSRIVRMVFWFSLFRQGEHFIGLFLADLLHTILAADYLYLWCRKLRTGGALIYKL